jgi:hypothetical protein
LSLSYHANDDRAAKGKNSLELEEVHHFDAIAGNRCKTALAGAAFG